MAATRKADRAESQAEQPTHARTGTRQSHARARTHRQKQRQRPEARNRKEQSRRGASAAEKREGKNDQRSKDQTRERRIGQPVPSRPRDTERQAPEGACTEKCERSWPAPSENRPTHPANDCSTGAPARHSVQRQRVADNRAAPCSTPTAGRPSDILSGRSAR